MKMTTRTCCPVCDTVIGAPLVRIGYNDPILQEWLRNHYRASPGFDSSVFMNASYALAECEKCRLVYQTDIPGEDLARLLYDEWPDAEADIAYHRSVDNLEYYSRYAHEVMRVIHRLKRIPGTIQCLDYGLGRGNWAHMVSAFGCESWGMDLSGNMSRIAAQKGIRIFVPGECKDVLFDFINIDQVLEHVSDPIAILRQVRNWLKPDGMIRISVPDGGDIKTRLKLMDWNAPNHSKRSLVAVYPIEHINCFGSGALTFLIEKVGYNRIHEPWYEKMPVLIRRLPGLKLRNMLFRPLSTLRSAAALLRDEMVYNFSPHPTTFLIQPRNET